MKILIKLLIVVLVLASIAGAAYAVLNPILKDLGVELGDIFKDETTKAPDDKKEPVECTHQVSEWASKDSTYHEGLCTVKDCGATVKEKHTYKKAFYQALDFEYHEKICDNCDYVVKEAHKYVNGVCACAFLEPDESETGNQGGTTHTEHNYEVYVKQNTTSHIMKCSIDGCTSTKSFDHQFGAEKVVTAASCETSGEKQSTCAICSYVKTTTIPAAGHNWEYSGGKTVAVCSVCGLECIHSDAIYDTDNYFPLNDEYHDFRVYCPVCGFWEYGSVINGFSSHYPHNYNSSGYCFRCGHTRYAGIPV